MSNPSIYFTGRFSSLASYACVFDTTPPTFVGITGLVANPNGSLTASWSAASDASPPIKYEVYIQANTSSGLFTNTNIVTLTYLTNFTIFLDANNDLLVKNAVYYVGVRALDSVNNRDSNIISLNATSLGVLSDDLATIAASLAATAASLITTEGNLAGDHVNFQSDHVNFQSDHTTFQSDHTNFNTDHSNFQSDHTNFDTDHTNFTIDHSNFQSDHSNFQSDHTNFGTDHTNFQSDHSNLQSDHSNFQSDHSNFQTDHTNFQADIAVLQGISHKAHGVFSINSSNQLLGTIWATYDGTVVLSNLGSASYSVYDATGTAVIGLSQTGLTPDINGRYIITPVLSSLQDLTHYTVKITININGTDYTSYRGITLGI